MVAPRLTGLQFEGEWPDHYGKAILPFLLFDSALMLGHAGREKKDCGLLALDLPAQFDLVIVDETRRRIDGGSRRKKW